MEALAWEQEPRKTHSVSRSFFDRGVGSSILASLSEAGGNDPHKSRSKPLPPRSKTREDRLSECASGSFWCTPRSIPSAFCRHRNSFYLFEFQSNLFAELRAT